MCDKSIKTVEKQAERLTFPVKTVPLHLADNCCKHLPVSILHFSHCLIKTSVQYIQLSLIVPSANFTTRHNK